MTRLLVGIFAGVFVSFGSYLLGTLALGVGDASLIVTTVGSTILGITAGVAVLYLLDCLTAKQQDDKSHRSTAEDLRSMFVSDGESGVPSVNSNQGGIRNLGQSLVPVSLGQNIHAFVFIILLGAIIRLQWSGDTFGWPFEKNGLSLFVDALVCIIVLSLAMMPFRFDSTRSFGIMNLVACTSIACVVATFLSRFSNNYSPFELLLSLVVITLATYGLLVEILHIISNR